MPAIGSPLLQIDDVVVVRGDRTLLDGVSLGVNAGDRIGVVGRNGSGKSTLLDTLCGSAEISAGRVVRSGGVTVARVDQHDRLPAGTVLAGVVGPAPRSQWAADPRIRAVITGLFGSLDAPILTRASSECSGGESRRAALARALIADADVLVLDEPTNHLDLVGVRWLAQFLRQLPRAHALVVVTHDRWFLDEVTTRTWEVHDGRVDTYDGGYAAYVLAKAERQRQLAVEDSRRANLMRKELAWLRRGPPARTSKPKFRIAAANALIEQEPPARDVLKLATVASARLGKKVLELTDVTVAPAPGVAPVVTDLTLHLGPGDRVGIVGPNGAGKTTLLRLISGVDVPVLAGTVERGVTVVAGTLDQQLRQVDPSARVLPWLSEVGNHIEVSTGEELTPTQLLEQFGFTGDAGWKRLGELSGGEVRRLFLLRMLLAGPNLVVLDEPTNDLDIETLTVLEDLLDTWPGTLVVVSHDAYFLERVCDHIYAVAGGQLRHLPGGLADYDVVLSGAGAHSGSAQPTTPATDATAALSPAQVHAARKRLKAIDRRLHTIASENAELHIRMAAAATDIDELTVLGRTAADLAGEQEQLEGEWLELAETLEG